MSQRVLPAHSLMEAHFYLLLQRCPGCQADRLRPEAPRHHFLGTQAVCTVPARCRGCGHTTEFHFATEGWPSESLAEAPETTPLPTVHPFPHPSKLIDLAQWLTLFRVIIEQTSGLGDRGEARRLGYEAALCLEEALKFYTPDNELPPQEAFFTPRSQQRFREHPAQFTRSQLLAWRDRLPSLARMRELIQQSRQTGKRKRRHWWPGKRRS